MENIFHHLASCVYLLLTHKSQLNYFNQEECRKIIGALSGHCNDVRKKLFDILLNINKSKQIHFVFHHFQCEMLHLSNLVFKELNDIRYSSQSHNQFLYALNYTAEALDEILNHLELYFPNYINQAELIPAIRRKVVCTRFQEILESIKGYRNLIKVGDKLWDQILEPAKLLIDESNVQAFSIGNIKWSNTFYNRLLPFLTALSNPLGEEETIKYLVQLNLNYPYLVNQIIKDLILADLPGNDVERYKELQWWRKEIKQHYMSFNDPCFTKIPSSNEILLKYVEEEIHYLVQVGNLNAEKLNEKNPNPEFTIISRLSVDQMASLLRLLYDDKILYCENKTELLRFFASILKTKAGKEVTFYSLRNKFNTVPVEELKKQRDLLFHLLNLNDKKIKG